MTGLRCAFVVVEPPFSYSARFLDGDEAAAVHSAAAAALEGAGGSPEWPVLMPVHGPARGAYEGRAGSCGGGGGGWAGGTDSTRSLPRSCFRGEHSTRLCGLC